MIIFISLCANLFDLQWFLIIILFLFLHFISALGILSLIFFSFEYEEVKSLAQKRSYPQYLQIIYNIEIF